MYDWSKGIIAKIKDANCLTNQELRMVEISLRMNEAYQDILDECLGISESNIYELEYGE